MKRFARENEFDDLVDHAAQLYGVPAWVIKTTIGKESSFDPRAQRKESAGRISRGLMQLLEATARELGFSGPAGDDALRVGGLYEPEKSIRYGTLYLRRLRNRYPAAGWDEIYGAYNSGAIRKNAAGQLVTVAADPIVEAHVEGWRRIADYFNPGWRTTGPLAPGA